jgi:limonene-1,2-epoxide hydrolase
MAYLSPFKYDIFISYAHVNDQLPPDGGPRWVTFFEQYLNDALAQEFGRNGAVAVWRDMRKMGGNTYFDDAIKDAINDSAIFMALLSNGYVSQESYCPRELEWFYSKAERDDYGVRIGHLSRLFNIRLQNIPPQQWPTQLAGRAGFKFHDDRAVSQSLRPGEEFRTQFREMFDELVPTLRTFKTLLEQTPKESVEGERVRRTVFLAHTEGRMIDIRSRVAEELTKKGVEIITDIPEPWEDKEHEKAVLSALDKSDLAVHMFDDAPGRKIKNAPEKFYSTEQVRLSLLHAKSQLIWVPDAIDMETIENVGHQQFLESLARRKLVKAEYGVSNPALDAIEELERLQAAYSFVREPKTSLPQVILDKLDALARAVKEERASDDDDGLPVALIDTHRKDYRLAVQDLGPVLAEQGLELRITPEGDEPRSRFSRFEASLKQASVFIVVFGQVAAEWVRERLDQAQKIIVKEKCQVSLCGVYIAGEPKDRKFVVPPRPPNSPPIARIAGPEQLKVLLETMVGVI